VDECKPLAPGSDIAPATENTIRHDLLAMLTTVPAATAPAAAAATPAAEAGAEESAKTPRAPAPVPAGAKDDYHFNSKTGRFYRQLALVPGATRPPRARAPAPVSGAIKSPRPVASVSGAAKSSRAAASVPVAAKPRNEKAAVPLPASSARPLQVGPGSIVGHVKLSDLLQDAK